MDTSKEPNPHVDDPPRVLRSAADLPGVPPKPVFRHVAYCESRGVLVGINGSGTTAWSKDKPSPPAVLKAPTFADLEDLYEFLGTTLRDTLPKGVELRQVPTTATLATVDEVALTGSGTWGR